MYRQKGLSEKQVLPVNVASGMQVQSIMNLFAQNLLGVTKYDVVLVLLTAKLCSSKQLNIRKYYASVRERLDHTKSVLCFCFPAEHA